MDGRKRGRKERVVVKRYAGEIPIEDALYKIIRQYIKSELANRM